MTELKSQSDMGVPLAGEWIRTYRALSLCGAIVFAIVGALFLLLPGGTLGFFSDMSSSVGLEPTPVESGVLYHVLAVGYMYLVTLLAWFMFRHPNNRLLPVLLLNAKSASSILSFVFFFGMSHTLIFLTNGVMDGSIAVGVYLMMRMQRRMT